MENFARRNPNIHLVNEINDKLKIELGQAGIGIINLKDPGEEEYSEVPYRCFGALGKEKIVVETNTMSHLWDREFPLRCIQHGTFSFVFMRAWYYWVVMGSVPLEVAQEMYANPIGKKDVRIAGHAGRVAPEKPWIRWDNGRWIVTSYHIDSQEGLNLFVETVKKHGLLEPTENKEQE